MPVEKAKKGKGKKSHSVDDAPVEQAKAALPKTPAKGRGKKVQVEIEEPEAIEPEGISPLPYLFIPLLVPRDIHY